MNSYLVAAGVLGVEGLTLVAAALPGLLRDLPRAAPEIVHTVQPGELPGKYPNHRAITSPSARVNPREATSWERV